MIKMIASNSRDEFNSLLNQSLGEGWIIRTEFAIAAAPETKRSRYTELFAILVEKPEKSQEQINNPDIVSNSPFSLSN